MRRMTLDELAQRAVRKKNREIKEKYPLFADQFATNFEIEKARIERQHREADEHLENLRRMEARYWELGMERRDTAKRLLLEDVWNEREEFWKRLHPNACPEYFGCELADYWWQALKGTEWAFENCPNRDHHDQDYWWKPRWNFLKGCFVESDECPTCGMKRKVE